MPRKLGAGKQSCKQVSEASLMQGESILPLFPSLPLFASGACFISDGFFTFITLGISQCINGKKKKVLLIVWVVETPCLKRHSVNKSLHALN